MNYNSDKMMAKAGRTYEKLVAYVVSSLDPNAQVENGIWVEGPDGRRDMDVFVRGQLDSKDFSILIECKDYDLASTGKVGIDLVDAIDSKKDDLGVDCAVICSNSGFTAPAIRKGKRKKIGLISVLKSEDKRVKVEIKEEVYTRIAKVGTISTSFNFTGEPLTRKDFKIDDVKYKGLSIRDWIDYRIPPIVFLNPTGTTNFNAKYNFKTPTKLDFGGTSAEINGLNFSFPIEVQWFSQVVTIDASLGLYDYIRGRVRLVPGEAKYIMKGVNIKGGTALDFVPDVGDLGSGLLKGEVDFRFMQCSGIRMVKPETVPNLDEIIMTEDLNLKAKV